MSSQEALHITSVIALHGVDADGSTLLVGVEINGQQKGWGICTNLFVDQSVNMVLITRLIRTVVAPALKERPFTSIGELFQRIDTLTENLTTAGPNPSSAAAPAQNVSRRQILSGQFKTQPVPQTPIERPLPASFRFGIGQAIVEAAAKTRHVTPTALLAADYGLKQRKTVMGLHLSVTDENIEIARPILRHHVKSMGYRIDNNNPKAVLGANAERLQKLVGDLSQWIQQTHANFRPLIHIDIQGSFSSLFGDDIAAAALALQQLQQAAAPLRIRIENIYDDANAETLALLNQLTVALGEHQKNIQTAAGFPLYRLSTISALIQANAISAVHLDVTQMGTPDQTMALIAMCHEKGVKVVLSGGENLKGVETAVHIAAATGVKIVAGPPDIVYNEIQRLKF